MGPRCSSAETQVVTGATLLQLILYRYSQTCIKRSVLGERKKWPYKTDDLLKEGQFICNYL